MNETASKKVSGVHRSQGRIAVRASTISGQSEGRQILYCARVMVFVCGSTPLCWVTIMQQGVETPTVLASNRQISPARSITCDCSLRGVGLDAHSNAIVSQLILIGGAIHLPSGHLSTAHHDACYMVKLGQGSACRDANAPRILTASVP